MGPRLCISLSNKLTAGAAITAGPGATPGGGRL